MVILINKQTKRTTANVILNLKVINKSDGGINAKG